MQRRRLGHQRGLRLGLLLAFGGTLLVGVGCASTAGVRMGASSSSPVFASLDEAALAGLAAAQANATAGTRQSIRVGAIRKVASGYVWLRPRFAVAGLHDGRPGVVRLRLAREDVATYVVHPASGDARLDRANAALSESEKRLLGSPTGPARPVYLLTPRLEVVRYAGERTSVEIATLRGSRCEARSLGRTPRRGEETVDRDGSGQDGAPCRSDQRAVGQRPA